MARDHVDETDDTELVAAIGLGDQAAMTEIVRRHREPVLAFARRRRDRLVHHFFDIDLDVLWLTVTGDLPDLLRVLGKSRD